MEQEILKVLDCYLETIRTQKKDLFDKIWAEQAKCSLISITNVFEGKESIYQDFLINGIQKAYSKIDLISDGTSVNLVNENLAIVIFNYHTECIQRDSGEVFGIQGIETQIMVKENGQWKLQHVHYSK